MNHIAARWRHPSLKTKENTCHLVNKVLLNVYGSLYVLKLLGKHFLLKLYGASHVFSGPVHTVKKGKTVMRFSLLVCLSGWPPAGNKAHFFDQFP